jgi:CBS domain-containing protein
MTDARAAGDRRARLPIRAREVVGVHSETRRILTVFCPFRERSMPLSVCERCEAYRESLGQEAIECAVPPGAELPLLFGDQPLFVGPGSLASRTSVGAVMSARVLCVDADMEVALLTRIGDYESYPGILLVDDDTRLVGILSRADLDSCKRRGAQAAVRTRDLVHADVRAVHESSSLAEALSRMVHEHLRVLAVVDDEEFVIGLLSDLDALRWVAENARREVVLRSGS